MAFILDASTTLDWALPDQRNERSNAIIPILMRSFALVPALWHFEVCAVLRENVKRKTISAEDAKRFIAELETYDIRTARVIPSMHELLSIAEQFDLTAYDAAYLELAKASRLPLATRDAELIQACTAYGVALLKS